MHKYNLVVCGGGTAGVAAGYIAAKLGLKTLIIEKNIHLGGTITSALVVPAMKSNTKDINCEFYNDFIKELASYGSQITYEDGNSGWFTPELAKIALDSLLSKTGCDIIFDSEILKNNILENNKKRQPMTLRFNISGIDTEIFSDWVMNLDKDRNVTTSCSVNGERHFSTAYTWDKSTNWALRPVFEQGIKDGIITEEDSSYFQIFSIPGMPGTISLNCPRILLDEDIDPFDPILQSKALIKARQQIWRIYSFLKKYFKGFENSYISNIADMLGIRESRRVKGAYVYTKDDLLSGRTYDEPVLHADYPIDIHSYKKDSSTLQKTVVDYELPIECLKAVNYDNLFIAGKIVSADFEAQAALRIQTSCFSMGEAVARHVKKLL